MVSATTPNALFAVLGVSNAAAVEAKLVTIAPWLYLKLQDGEWMIMAPAATTAKEVSDRLGLTGQTENPYTGIVTRVESYFGRSATSNWQWIVAKQGEPLGTATVQG
jgi:hypothetical protein